MPRRSELRLTKRTVDALTVETKDTVFWDRDLAGFGVRVHATGRKAYVVQSRGPGGLKRVTLGHHGDMAADEARKRAAVVIDRIKRGGPPVSAPPAPELTVAALAERYMRAHVLVRCKPSTAGTYRFVLDRHILPALGETPVGAVGRSDIAALHHRLRDDAHHGQRGGRYPLEDVLARRGVGPNSAGAKPVPGRAPLPDAHSGAIPYARGVPASREGVERRQSRWLGVAAGRRGNPAADADRMPTLRDSDAALGRCGPHGGRVEAARFQDGSPHGAPDPGGGGGARRHRSGAGKPVGDCRTATQRPPDEARQLLAAHPGHGEA